MSDWLRVVFQVSALALSVCALVATHISYRNARKAYTRAFGVPPPRSASVRVTCWVAGQVVTVARRIWSWIRASRLWRWSR